MIILIHLDVTSSYYYLFAHSLTIWPKTWLICMPYVYTTPTQMQLVTKMSTSTRWMFLGLLWLLTHQFCATFIVQLCCQCNFPIARWASHCHTCIEKLCWWEVYIIFFTFPPLIRTNTTYNGPAYGAIAIVSHFTLTLAFCINNCANHQANWMLYPLILLIDPSN